MNQEYTELEQMKQQLSILQKRIDEQTQINDRMIKTAIRKSMDRLQNLGMKSFIFCVFGVFFVEAMLIISGLSIGFQIFTFIFLSGNAVYAYFLKVKKADVMDAGNLVLTAERVLKYKKDFINSFKVGIPFLIIWIGLYMWELGKTMGFDSAKDYGVMMLFLLFGTAIGGCIGWYVFSRPSLRQADSILEQIEELKED